MGKVTLSPLLIEDYDTIMELWHQCEGVGLSGADSKDNIQRFLDKNPGMSFLASLEGRIIGTILAGQDQRRGYVYHLAVHSQYRRQGIGFKLVERCLLALQEAGIQKCHLFVFNINEPGIAFWKSVGWEERSDLRVMSKVLEPNDREVFSKKGSPNTKDQPEKRTDTLIAIRKMAGRDWPSVRSIFEEGITSGSATFETAAPSWEDWDAGHLKECRLVAVQQERVMGWAALSRVSGRCVYAGVAEVSIYVTNGEKGRGIGKRLLQTLIMDSEQNGLWTLQAGIFPENEASINLHRNCGFRLISRREKLGQMNGRWRDVLLFERRSPVVGIENPNES